MRPGLLAAALGSHARLALPLGTCASTGVLIQKTGASGRRVLSATRRYVCMCKKYRQKRRRLCATGSDRQIKIARRRLYEIPDRFRAILHSTDVLGVLQMPCISDLRRGQNGELSYHSLRQQGRWGEIWASEEVWLSRSWFRDIILIVLARRFNVYRAIVK